MQSCKFQGFLSLYNLYEMNSREVLAVLRCTTGRCPGHPPHHPGAVPRRPLHVRQQQGNPRV